ncbi:hypothetical protein Tco_1461641 [Tanacetum coccineum]
MDTEEVSERYITLCFVDGLNSYDGEVNLEYEKNMISNEFAVKLCLEYEVKNGEKVMKRELLVALRGELYFVKFIINPEQDDVKLKVVFGRSFLKITKGIVDFRNGILISVKYTYSYGYTKDHKKTVKNRQARTRESVEYKAEARKVKPQSKSAKKSQSQSKMVKLSQTQKDKSSKYFTLVP